MIAPSTSAASPSDVEASVSQAVAALRAGKPVVMPTDTVFGVAAMLSSQRALDALWSLKGGQRSALALHLDSRAALESLLWPAGGASGTPLQRRLVDRLIPGAVTLAVAMDEANLDRVRASSGNAAPGVIDEKGEALVRVPARAFTQRVLREVASGVVIASLPGIGVGVSGARRPARNAEEARAVLGEPGLRALGAFVDDGLATIGTQSTLVRLTRAGGYEVVREGALPRRAIDRAMLRTILFVCTGNTCRSPMAAAIARHVLGQTHADGIETRVESAGTAAGFGMEATPEGSHALRAMGIDPGSHRSTPVSRDMLRDADFVFGLTRGHVEVLRRMDPMLGDRLLLLDPDGADVPDPIGGSQSLYDATAAALRGMIERRIAQILQRKNT